ncbi:MAG: MBL fold metallo-hydrolase [Dehalococcoidia bacterium]
MVEVKEVADKVFWFEPKIHGVNNIFSAYLIKEAGGVLIEPGPSAAVPAIQEAMKHLGMNDLAYIIPTHIHVDHAGGAGTLSGLFPRAEVLVHPRGAKHVVDPSGLIASTKTVFGDNFEDSFGPVLPVPESRIRTPEDGEVISVNGRELQIIYAPGHAPHNMVIFDLSVRGIFCGEAVGLPGQGEEPLPLPAVAPPSFDQDQYLETMEMLRQLGARMLFFSHGGVGRDPDKLISIASEYTRLLGDIILKAMKAGETPEIISRRVRDYASSRFGRELDEMDLAMIVGGYAIYFTRKGLA